MKNFTLIFCLGALISWAGASYGVSAGTVGAGDARGAVAGNYTQTSGAFRGKQQLANAYKANQRNTYYMVTQPDVDTECRKRIYNCLSDYCGDVTAVPGQRSNRCQYSSESELYNYAMLCLQKDTSVLLPQYATGTMNAGMNTAARLCTSYVQQEVMSYLAMATMSDQLAKSHSDLCLQRRQELEAAMACHSIAMAYGNETASKLNAQLTDYCGAGVPGGSAEMVTRFANAGNVGANIWGWAEKIVSLDMNNKGADWQAAVDSVLAGYTNRMNLACGDNLQINTADYSSGSSSQPTALQTAAALITGVAFPSTGGGNPDNPYQNQSLYMQVTSLSRLDDYNTAKQVVNAALTNSAMTQNAFLTSAQMDSMQNAYKLGTKVFVVEDGTRCYTIPVQPLTSQESSLMAQTFASCRNQ
ncbi:MAG: hypothetical protein K2I81_00055 [Alphaproteobacteria bacterium]|nr:hypothetical protein [Alphaproteobacteria bacterium]